MSRLVRVRHLGLVSYSAGLVAQREALSAHQAALAADEPAPHQLLLLEHRPVYTVGRRQRGADITQEEARLRRLGAEFERTGRGGLTTFHGPGQLVAYPMLNLRQLGVPGPRRFVCHLEQAVVEVCGRLGVRAGTSPHTGVWVGDNKICALGIHLTQRVLTSHGLALNCCVDLDWFRHIVPCGIADKFVTSLSAELGRHVLVAEAVPLLVDALVGRLGCELQWDGDSRAKETDDQVDDVIAARPMTAD